MATGTIDYTLTTKAAVKMEFYVRDGVAAKLNYHYRVIRSKFTTEQGKRFHREQIKTVLREAMDIFSQIHPMFEDKAIFELRQSVAIASCTLGLDK